MSNKPARNYKATARGRSVIIKDNAQKLTQFDHYYYDVDGSLLLQYGKPKEIKLTLPAGNYEIEARATLYNNNSTSQRYYCQLKYYIDSDVRTEWEGGAIEDTWNTTPLRMQFKAMAKFDSIRSVTFMLSSNASKGFLAENVKLIITRIGSIYAATKN